MSIVLAIAFWRQGSIGARYEIKPQLMRASANISKKISVIEKTNPTQYKKEVSITAVQTLTASFEKKPLNTLQKHMIELLISLLNFFGLAWWVEIKTATPRCTYYFGPFLTAKEAGSAKTGYIEDLENEGAQGIVVAIVRCKPIDLTVADDLGKIGEGEMLPIFSGQS